MKLSNQAVEILITEIAGKDIMPMIELIRGKFDVSEFKIAEKMSISVNEVRNMLYRLSNYNLVSFTRRKDKKKGWYIYYWTFEEARAKEIFDRLLNLKIEKLHKMLVDEQQEQYYHCKEDKLRFNATEAMEIDFKCPECGQVLEQEDNVKRIEKVKERLQDLEAKDKFYVEEKIKRPKVKKKEIKKKTKKKITKKVKKKAKKKKAKKRPPRKKIKKKTSKKKVKKSISKRPKKTKSNKISKKTKRKVRKPKKKSRKRR